MPESVRSPRPRLRFAAPLAAAVLAFGALPVSAAGPNGEPGFHTDAPPMLAPVGPDVTVKPLLAVGDTIGGYRFEAIPDGIAIDPKGGDTVDVYVNHETSKVPFPATLTDFDNAQLSHLVLRRGNGKVLSGEIVIGSESNYQRFCSNFFVGAAQGSSRDLVVTNEETSDTVNRVGTAWPLGAGSSPEQAGVAVAYDVSTGDHRTVYGLGRMNHENSVAVPGFGRMVLVTGDDTFSAPSSQLYMYLGDAGDGDAVWDDSGHLWAFRSDDPNVNDYGDLSGSASVSGQFIVVPDAVADGDQAGLETWSNANDVFQFIRIEDLAYDRNSPNVVYFADTGEPRAKPGATPADRMTREASSFQGPYMNGRIFRLALDPGDPTHGTLSILIDADAGGYRNAAALHQPDNIETTGGSLLIQEDPGGHNRFAGGTNARIWRYDFASGSLEVVAEIPEAYNVDRETTGIVDASDYFGRGAFLVNVQAHDAASYVDTAPLPSNGSITQKREGGQLLLLRVPGA